MSPPEDYFYSNMLGLDPNVHDWSDFGSMHWELVLCLLASWIIVCGALIKGVEFTFSLKFTKFSFFLKIYFFLKFHFLLKIDILVKIHNFHKVNNFHKILFYPKFINSPNSHLTQNSLFLQIYFFFLKFHT